MKRVGLIVIAIISVFVIYNCQTGDKKTTSADSVKIAFYNLENLFDTIDSPDTEDSEFLPGSDLNWDTEKVNKKIKNLSKVLLSIDDENPPAIIGLCEVENRNILQDFINQSDLKNYNYQVVHKESPDFRGIDVALLYQKGTYRPIQNEWIEISFPFDEGYTTRDILYSMGTLGNDDTLHLFVNHWTSRWGGQEATEPKRIFLAELIKSKCDEILAENEYANIIVMGDVNDNPTDKSLVEGLDCVSGLNTIDNDKLYNLSYPKYQNGEGTLFWKTWDLFDQMIVSGSLLMDENDLKIKEKTHYIFKEDWMLYTDNEGNKRPSRTASSGNYYGGYSDHLPVWLELELQ